MSDRNVARQYKRAMDQLRSEEVAATSISWTTLSSGTQEPADMEVDIPDFYMSNATDSTPPVTPNDLHHLLDLVMLRTEFTQLRHQLPNPSSLTFSQPRQYIAQNYYPQLDINTITHTNDGPSALDARQDSNNSFIRFESDIFRIYISLNRLGNVSEHLTMHAAFHNRIIADVKETLMDLDMVKEVEWNRQRYFIQRTIRNNGHLVVDTGQELTPFATCSRIPD